MRHFTRSMPPKDSSKYALFSEITSITNHRLQASSHVRQWATDRWEVATRVNLMSELSTLKAQCRRARERKSREEEEEEQLLM